jgi:uncharacterized protein
VVAVLALAKETLPGPEPPRPAVRLERAPFVIAEEPAPLSTPDHGESVRTVRTIRLVPATADDVAELTALLGRPPQADFEVVVRTPTGRVAVIRNAPLLDDGTPMPTRYWLVDPDLVLAVSRVEAEGGVRAAERAVDQDALADAHAAYAEERDAAMPAEHVGPRPRGGVGGTGVGVKCLHAHYAYFLAGGDDPVGRWVDEKLPSPAGEST